MIQPSLPMWLAYIEQHVGFMLPKNQQQWLINAINTVAHHHGLTPQALYDNLQKDSELHQQLIDTVLIIESRFFRDRATLDYIAKLYDERLIAGHQTPFVVSSIGCAQGQEVWSLAMVLDQCRQAYGNQKHRHTTAYEVVGVDTSKHALQVAQEAIYTQRCASDIPAQYHHYIIHETDDTWRVHQSLYGYADFVWCNIFSDESFKQLAYRHRTLKPSVILCQNTLIYFRKFDQRDILARLVELLEEGGYLILGAAECLFWQHPKMQRIHHPTINAWQKISA